MLRPCEMCGQCFAPRPRSKDQSPSRFCSRECFSASQRKRALNFCERCGKGFEVKESHSERRRFCSRGCMSADYKERFPAGVRPQIKQIALTCERCGKGYLRPPCEAKGSRFCSRACKASNVLLACERCGKSYVKPRAHADRSRFCSQACMHPPNAQTCLGCGNEYRISPGEQARSKYCSPNCRTATWRRDGSPNWKGGRDASAARRRRKISSTKVDPVGRKTIIARDGKTCYICRRQLTDGEIEIEHVTPLSRNGTHTPDNLRVSCKTCNCRKGAKLLSEFICFLDT